jgi:AraC-like DNA-binding protein
MAIGPLYRCFVDVAREHGVDIAPLLHAQGLSEATLFDPATRLAPEAGRALGAALVRATKLPAFGLEAALRFKLGEFEMLGYLMKHAQDVWGMLSAAEQHSRLLGDTASFRVARGRDEVIVTVGRTGGRKLLHEASDFAAVVVARCLRELAAAEIDPTEVRLPREAPADARGYRRFFRCPIRFGAEEVTLVYPAHILAVPCRAADPLLARILGKHAAEEIARLPADGTIETRVRAHIAQHLEHGAQEVAEVARLLGMSERTLRRRLREAGTGYRELLDEVRRERALMLADQAQHGATEIALRVGFEDGAAFARAFRRWTGHLPSDYLAARRVDARSSASEQDQAARVLRLVRPA